MKKATLVRYYTPYGVLGELTMPSGKTLKTLERPWLNNQKSLSCIPEGTYLCCRVKSPRFGDTFEVDAVTGRTHILFHAGNKIKHSLGCILVGRYSLISSNQLEIRRSKDSMAEFLEELKSVNEFQLSISAFAPVWP